MEQHKQGLSGENSDLLASLNEDGHKMYSGITESVFFKVFVLSPFAISLIHGRSGKYMEANASCHTILGYEPGMLIGRTTNELNITDASFRKHITDNLRLKALIQNEIFEFKQPSGETRTGELSVEKIYLNGEAYYLSIFNDITEKQQVEQALEDKHELLEFVLDATEIGYWEVDLKTSTSKSSQRHYEIFGYATRPPGWGVDLFLNEHVHPEDKVRAKALYQQFFTNGFEKGYECRIIRTDGEVRWVTGRRQFVKFDLGKPTRMIGYMKDVTDHKKLEETRYSSIFSQSLMSIAILDGPNMIVKSANAPFLSMLGKGPHIIGKPLLEVLPEIKDQAFPSLLRQVFATGEPYYGYETKGMLIRNGHPEEVYFNFIYQPFREFGDVITGVIVLATEVTEQALVKKQVEEIAVEQMALRLVAEEERVKAQEATLLAEAASQAKQRFLSNMSHELRTPLNSIIGFTKVMLRTSLSPKQKEYLGAIETSGDAMLVLINDILDLAKMEAGKMTFEAIPFQLQESVGSMIHLFETRIHEKHLEVVKVYDGSIPEVVEGDPGRLQQIILNLLSNAVKFTDQGRITVSVSLLREDERHLLIEFSFTDTGLGIADDKIEAIFENFQQASSETGRLFGGTGLGLSIVKHLVEAQGGRIWVESRLGEGSTFSFTLPFQKTDQLALSGGDEVALDTSVKNIRVLVVEDMKLNQLLMRTIMEDFGFSYAMASNGKIAVEKLQTESFDIILMDLQMPVMDGYEATTYIRVVMKLETPIIALTADVTPSDIAQCLAIGMDDFIGKPLDEQLLYAKMISLVRSPKS